MPKDKWLSANVRAKSARLAARIRRQDAEDAHRLADGLARHRQDKVAARRRKKAMKHPRPMESFVDADSVTYRCPCGASVTGEGKIIGLFKKAHRANCNGKLVETITPDGLRFVTPDENPTTVDL